MHMDPFLPNHGAPGQGLRLTVGMALAVEPMLTAGDPETRELDDGWTVVTADGSRAAHWEHTVAVTDDGPRILTLPPERQGLAVRVSVMRLPATALRLVFATGYVLLGALGAG